MESGISVFVSFKLGSLTYLSIQGAGLYLGFLYGGGGGGGELLDSKWRQGSYRGWYIPLPH